jgi:hypothetical protein
MVTLLSNGESSSKSNEKEQKHHYDSSVASSVERLGYGLETKKQTLNSRRQDNFLSSKATTVQPAGA